MGKVGERPGIVWRAMRRINHLVLRKYGPDFRAYGFVLLLVTLGRKTGQPRPTPLQYEVEGDAYYIGSARGVEADWVRNIQANPHVQVRVQEQCFQGNAELVTDPKRVADFFQLRLDRHPIMIGLLMRLEGLPLRYSRADLERFASQKAMVVVRPEQPIPA
jgi:deazaflavin-dependent oxidoreductase (nitroreductase family)